MRSVDEIKHYKSLCDEYEATIKVSSLCGQVNIKTDKSSNMLLPGSGGAHL